MAYLMIGSSNIARLYPLLQFPAHPAYTMTKCVNLDLFKVRMDNINSNEKFVIISVLDNFFIDKAKSSTDKTPENYLHLVRQSLLTPWLH